MILKLIISKIVLFFQGMGTTKIILVIVSSVLVVAAPIAIVELNRKNDNSVMESYVNNLDKTDSPKTSSTKTSKTKYENKNYKNKDYESSEVNHYNKPNNYELQNDANIVCKSRAAVLNAANYYDRFIAICNSGGVNVYSDCTQYDADRLAREVDSVASTRNRNERDFINKWGSSAYNSISCSYY